MTQKLLFDVLCWTTGVSGPYFFEYEDGQRISVTSKRYTVVINKFLATKLPPNHNFCFQQDSLMIHTAVIRALVSSTDDVPWPPHSPDLTAPDFFCDVRENSSTFYFNANKYVL
jgi:hypothetical protein